MAVARKASHSRKSRAPGQRLIQVRPGVAALRNVRLGLMDLALGLAGRPDSRGFLVLSGTGITEARLRNEWRLVASAFRPELLDRMSLCVGEAGHFIGIPRDPDPETQHALARAVAAEGSSHRGRPVRSDASFVVLKVLIHHWLQSGQPVTSDWLARIAGYSYPSMAAALRALGSLIERGSDRRIRLRWFPRGEFARLVATSDRARGTVRFADRSGQPRSAAAHLRRLEQMALPNVAIGGILAAQRHLPDLDMVGVPRLDLSQHCPGKRMDLGFVAKLDPGLKPVDDPLAPASVVVHAVRHADPLFSPRQGGLHWVDPVECLLDLHEARLDAQATQLLDHLQRQRPASP